jgi:hypothetical protein
MMAERGRPTRAFSCGRRRSNLQPLDTCSREMSNHRYHTDLAMHQTGATPSARFTSPTDRLSTTRPQDAPRCANSRRLPLPVALVPLHVAIPPTILLHRPCGPTTRCAPLRPATHLIDARY